MSAREYLYGGFGPGQRQRQEVERVVKLRRVFASDVVRAVGADVAVYDALVALLEAANARQASGVYTKQEVYDTFETLIRFVDTVRAYLVAEE